MKKLLVTWWQRLKSLKEWLPHPRDIVREILATLAVIGIFRSYTKGGLMRLRAAIRDWWYKGGTQRIAADKKTLDYSPGKAPFVVNIFFGILLVLVIALLAILSPWLYAWVILGGWAEEHLNVPSSLAFAIDWILAIIYVSTSYMMIKGLLQGRLGRAAWGGVAFFLVVAFLQASFPRVVNFDPHTRQPKAFIGSTPADVKRSTEYAFDEELGVDLAPATPEAANEYRLLNPGLFAWWRGKLLGEELIVKVEGGGIIQVSQGDKKLLEKKAGTAGVVSVTYGEWVTLTSLDTEDTEFVGWDHGCKSAVGRECQLQMTGRQLVTGYFTAAKPPVETWMAIGRAVAARGLEVHIRRLGIRTYKGNAHALLDVSVCNTAKGFFPNGNMVLWYTYAKQDTVFWRVKRREIASGQCYSETYAEAVASSFGLREAQGSFHLDVEDDKNADASVSLGTAQEAEAAEEPRESLVVLPPSDGYIIKQRAALSAPFVQYEFFLGKAVYVRKIRIFLRRITSYDDAVVIDVTLCNETDFTLMKAIGFQYNDPDRLYPSLQISKEFSPLDGLYPYQCKNYAVETENAPQKIQRPFGSLRVYVDYEGFFDTGGSTFIDIEKLLTPEPPPPPSVMPGLPIEVSSRPEDNGKKEAKEEEKNAQAPAVPPFSEPSLKPWERALLEGTLQAPAAYRLELVILGGGDVPIEFEPESEISQGSAYRKYVFLIPGGMSLALDPVPYRRYRFSRWGGSACVDSPYTCQVLMDGDKYVVAYFE